MSILSEFRTIIYSIEISIFNLAISAYNMIYKLVNFNSFIENSAEILKNISESIYMFLAIIMFFKLAFSLLSMLVDPNKISDKENGAEKIIKNIAITLILIFMVPTFFTYLFKVQDVIMENRIIENIFESSVPPASERKNLAETVSKNIHSAFINVSDEAPKDDLAVIYYNTIFEEEGNYSNNKTLIEEGILNSTFLNSKRKKTYIFSYQPLLSFVASIVVLWIFLSFTIDVATRSFKLFFLQILSPIAIVSNVDPKSSKNGIFKKWTDEVLKTYLSLFIRITALTLVSVIVGSLKLEGMEFFTKLFLLLGFLTFLKMAPKMLEKIFGLEAKSKEESFGRSLLKGALAGGTAMAIGGLSGAVGAKRHGSSLLGGLAVGAGSGLTSGASSGYKGSASGIAKSMFAGSAAVGKTYGYKTGMEKMKENMRLKSEESFGNKQFKDFNNKFKNHNVSKTSFDNFVQNSKNKGYSLKDMKLNDKEQKTLVKGLATSEAKGSLIRDNNIREKVQLLEEQKALERIAKSRYKEEYANFQMLGPNASNNDKLKIIKAEADYEAITGAKEGTKAQLDLLLKRNSDSIDKKVLDSLELGLTAHKPDESGIDNFLNELNPKEYRNYENIVPTDESKNYKERQDVEEIFEQEPIDVEDTKPREYSDEEVEDITEDNNKKQQEEQKRQEELKQQEEQKRQEEMNEELEEKNNEIEVLNNEINKLKNYLITETDETTIKNLENKIRLLEQRRNEL